MSLASSTLTSDTPATLTQLLCEHAQQRPQQVAFRYESDTGEQTVWTYGQLDRRVRAVAAQLAACSKPGDRALLVYPPGLEFVAGFFGCLYAGVLPVPATYPKPRRPLPRLDAIAEDCTPSLALTTAGALETLKLDEQSAAVRGLQWIASDQAERQMDESALRAFQPRIAKSTDPAFLQYTSGSTSQPRGVVISHGNVMHNLELIRQGFGMDIAAEGQTPLEGVFWLPAYHDMGLIGGVLSPIYVGGTSSLMAPAAFLRRPLAWLEAMSATGAEISGAPNFAYELCVEKSTPEQRAALDLSRWEVAFCGAEPIDPATLERFAEAFAPAGFRKSAFLPCYGLAEATLMVSGSGRREPVTLEVDREAFSRREIVVSPSPTTATRTLLSCGQPLGDQDVVIVDPQTCEPCESDRIGEIWLRGGSVAHGYWREEADAENSFAGRLADVDGTFLQTGDLGFIHEGADSEELFVTGRLKDVVIVRGRNHYPQDLERSAQQAHEAIDLGAAFAVDLSEADSTDGRGGEQLVVVHQVHREHRRGNLDEALRAVRAAIVDQHELDPHAIVLIKPAGLPLTSSGKVQRNRCREMYVNGELAVLDSWQHSTRDQAPAESKASSNGVADLSFLKSAAQMDEDQLSHEVERWMLALLATKVDASEAAIKGDTPFAELGIDSMTSIELSLEFEQALGLQLPPDAAWSHPTPASLSRFLAQQLLAKSATTASSTASSSTAS